MSEAVAWPSHWPSGHMAPLGIPALRVRGGVLTTPTAKHMVRVAASQGGRGKI